MKGAEKAKELGATAKAKASGLLDIAVKTMTKNPLKSAVVATCIYALFPLGLWLDYLLTSEKALGLNEWGDFLAGAFGPIAFMWLVIGYLQQGRELRQSANALIDQSKHLEDSVRQQDRLVHEMRKTLAYERESNLRRNAPTLRLSSTLMELVKQDSPTDGISISANVTNYGEQITDVVISVCSNRSTLETTAHTEILRKDGWFNFEVFVFELDKPFLQGDFFFLYVTYLDMHHNEGKAYFKLSLQKDGSLVVSNMSTGAPLSYDKLYDEMLNSFNASF